MYEERLKHYLDDASPDIDIIKEAIASLEGHFELISEKELLHFSRVDAIAYLALKSIVKCKDCRHFNWSTDSCERTGNLVSEKFYCADGERK